MNGLYRKALAIYEKRTQLRIVRPGEQAPGPVAKEEDSDGITAEERRLIEERIDRISSEHRIDISPATLAYTPRRRGEVLPIVTWAVVIAVVVLAILVMSRLLNRQEETLASGQAAVQTTEGKLIAALKEESDQQLRQRDQAIRDAQDRLQALNTERDQLRDNADSLVKAREQELRGEFDRTLAAEKDRLEKQGLADTAVTERLKQFEESRRQEMDRLLAAARQKAAEDLAAKERALGDLSTQYQRDLESARQDRLRLQTEARAKEAELQKQNAQNAQAAESEKARVTDELTRLRAQQEQERLVLDQVLSGYERVYRSLQAPDYALALQNLDILRKFFDDPSVAGLPTVQKRRSVEMFLIGSLDELIRGRQSRAGVDTAALLEASALLRSVGDLVERGDALTQSGDTAGARDSYLSALGKIPAVGRGYSRLDAMRTSAEEQKARELAAGLRQANVFYQAGNVLASVERYRQSLGLVLKDEALSKQITDNVMNAGYRLLAADDLAQLARLKTQAERRQAVANRVAGLADQYRAYTLLVPQAASDLPSPEALATILQAKIILRQVLESEDVRTKYPEIGAAVERYLAALGEQGRIEGRREALDGLAALLVRLGAPDAGTLPYLSRHPFSGEADPLLALLDRLATLLK